jgi:glycosyltransferase involved in cell wall biosynthesis
MILLDAIYINNSGGKILLDYLIQSLELQNLNITYLLDARIKNKHPLIKKTNTLAYMDADLRKRHSYYKANTNTFSTILCFGNLPPTINLRATVYTYFHQKLFLEIPKLLPINQRIVLKVKTVIFNFLKSNTDFWIVQTELMKQNLSENNIPKNNILVIPFYPNLGNNSQENKIDNTFLYVSSGSSHKNHQVLLEAFKLHYDQYKTGELHLTIGKEFNLLLANIKNLVHKKYPVINHGFVNREKLAKLYNSCTFVIYPSLSESFGLGLLEGLENNCKIIGANLPYTFAVCNPSLIFEPNNIKSIAKTFYTATNQGLKPSEQLAHNEINKIIQLLKNENENTK